MIHSLERKELGQQNRAAQKRFVYEAIVELRGPSRAGIDGIVLLRAEGAPHRSWTAEFRDCGTPDQLLHSRHDGRAYALGRR